MAIVWRGACRACNRTSSRLDRFGVCPRCQNNAKDVRPSGDRMLFYFALVFAALLALLVFLTPKG